MVAIMTLVMMAGLSLPNNDGTRAIVKNIPPAEMIMPCQIIRLSINKCAYAWYGSNRYKKYL